MAEKTYQMGVTEGRLNGLEAMHVETKDRLDSHAQRLRLLERVVWAIFGIGVIVQVWPKFAAIFLQ